MSKGIVIFAFDSSMQPYTKIAAVAAQLAKIALGLPVTLITNIENVANSAVFDCVLVLDDVKGQSRLITQDNSFSKLEWKNQNRVDAYSLSPYEQTLLIDADYFIFSQHLLTMFDSNLDFAVYTDAVDITGMSQITSIRLNNISIPMSWATVVYFRKSKVASAVFDMMETVRDQYHYYAAMYGFNESQYRNDYALSIALHALHGYSPKINSIPGKLQTVTHSNIWVIEDSVMFLTSGGVSRTSNVDLHIMNKFLFHDNKFLDEVITLAKRK